jgi:hypothetical protein
MRAKPVDPAELVTLVASPDPPLGVPHLLGLPLELPGRVAFKMDMELVPGELHLELHLLP